MLDPEIFQHKKYFFDSFKGKFNLSACLQKHKKEFMAIALVHIQGAKKHGCYTYLNEPIGHNGSIRENIDAYIRHFCAHTIGKIWDPDGLPHIFHMLCRAEMILASYYRFQNTVSNLSTKTIWDLPEVAKPLLNDETIYHLEPGYFTTFYPLVTFYKFEDAHVFKSDEFIPSIQNQLYVLVNQQEPHPDEIESALHPEKWKELLKEPDEIQTQSILNDDGSLYESLFLITSQYFQSELPDESWNALVDALPEKDRDYCRQFLSISIKERQS